MLRNVNALAGDRIQATDGELGKVDEFYFEDKTWGIRYLVVETGSWLLGRKVLISTAALKAPDWQGKIFPVALTREQVRTSPDIDTEKTVSRQHEIELQQHYAWGGGFYAGGMSGNFMFPQVREEAEKLEAWPPGLPEEDSHLRGTRAVTGYSLHASDGPIGHVEDFILDDGKWNMVFLVADAGIWLPGRKVLISPHWIKRVSWETSEVFVDLSQAAVRNSPEFDPSKPVSGEYESVLYDHYGRPRKL
jgi:uncharacterized protein YrrD